MDIELTGLAYKRIFSLLAEAFNTQYTVQHAEFFLRIPEDHGSGLITGIQYPNGVGFLHMNVVLKEPTRLIYSSHQVHPLRFVYALKNDIVHQFNNEDEEHTIEQYHSAIIASKYPYGHTFTIPSEVETTLTSLEIDRKMFTAQLSEEAHDMKNIFYQLFFDTFATRTIFHKGLYSLQLSVIIDQIREFDQVDFVRTNFIGSKALEMLSFMLMQYEDDLRDEGTGKVLRKSEINAVRKAVNVIDNNLVQLPSVQDLAKQVALTPAKLQEGFKLLYGSTVNDYIVNKRLETAFRLLSETEDQIGDVILDVGLSSRSYFSKIFKEKYNVSPIEVKLGRNSKKDIKS